MAYTRKSILLLSDDMLGEIWTYLSTWESDQLALDLINERAGFANVSLAAALGEEKSKSLAYCLRNARECIRTPQAEFIPRIVTRYYGCMWLVSAIMISDPATEYTLERVEARTKQGHGLGNIAREQSQFPQSEFIYLREQGLFPAYLRYLGLTKDDLKSIRPTAHRFESFEDLSDDDRSKLVSLIDVLARVPEIRNYVVETTAE